MGNRTSDHREQEAQERGFGVWFSDEEEDRRRRRKRKRGRKSGRRFSFGRRKSQKEELDDPFDMFNDMMDFGFGRGPHQQGFGLGDQMRRMIEQASKSGNPGGSFQSSQLFSSVTSIGNDGIAVSESKGVSQNSNGRYKMAHQRRIGDRSQTLMRERQNKQTAFKESQRLHQITHDELPRFSSEFQDRTREWNSHRALKSMNKPVLALEDGKRSRAGQPSHMRPVTNQGQPSYMRSATNQNYRGPAKNYNNYRPRGIEY